MRVLHLLGSMGPTSIPAQWVRIQNSINAEVTYMVVGKKSLIVTLMQLIKTVRTSKPDVLHVHNAYGILIALIATIANDVALVVHLHRSYRNLSLSAKILYRFGMLAKARCIIVNSFATQQSLPMREARSGKVCVIYNGIDLSAVPSVPEWQADYSKQVRLITVCRLIKEKNLGALIESVRILNLNSSAREYFLTVVGDGPERAQLESMVERFGCAHLVKFTGLLNASDVYQELIVADLFVMCSHTEGFCNALVEAMACSLPCVVTPAGALPEVVGETGWVTKGFAGPDIADSVQALVLSESAEIGKRVKDAKDRARSMSMRDSVLNMFVAYGIARAGGRYFFDQFVEKR